VKLLDDLTPFNPDGTYLDDSMPSDGLKAGGFHIDKNETLVTVL